LTRMHWFFLFFLLSASAGAQSFGPPAGFPGSAAIAASSPEIITWASVVAEEHRGFRNISNLQSGMASAGNSVNALGPAMQNGTFSLGDGGSITLAFPRPLCDKAGMDFAVFENGFSDGFLELAFVEASSNGIDFFAFPAYSETSFAIQKGPFDTLDARCLHNLAGKYRTGFGTGFDLAELAGNSGFDVSQVKYIRLRDVVGSILPEHATYDVLGRMVNDPWPTDFESSGFDLDAVAALHLAGEDAPLIWPSLLGQGDAFYFVSDETMPLELLHSSGRLMASFPAGSGNSARLPAGMAPGIYLFRVQGRSASRKVMIR